MRLACLLLVLFTSATGSAGSFPEVHEIRLQNGMKFLLVPRGEAPIFSAVVRFPVGGVDEEKGKTGLAHLVEHMAFKGTKDLTELEMSRRVEAEGGQDFNASTSKDVTTYRVDFPADRLAFWAELESERIFRPVFRDFEKEKNVVLEERRTRVDDDPEGLFFERLVEEAFGDTAYGWPTVGFADDLKALTSEDLRHFWEQHYDPALAVGVLAGKIDLKETERILRRTFGKIPTRRPHPKMPQADPPQLGKQFHLEKNARPLLVVGYLKPTLPHRDDYVFDLIDQILGDGRSSRLYRHLVREKKVAAGVTTYQGFPGARFSNLFLITVTPLGDQTKEALLETEAVVDRFLREGPTDRELSKAVNRLQTQMVWRLKTNDGLAEELSYFQLLAGNWHYLRDYADQIAGISKEEIQRVAERYLRPENRIIGEMTP